LICVPVTVMVRLVTVGSVLWRFRSPAARKIKTVFFFSLFCWFSIVLIPETRGRKTPEKSYYTGDYSGVANTIIAVMNHILNFIKKQKIHLIGWTVFILCEILIVGFATDLFGDAESYIIHYTLNILLFYFCAHWAYPTIFRNAFHWVWKLPLLGGFTFLCYLLLNYVVDTQIIKHQSWKTVQELDMGYKYVLGVLYRAALFMGNACFYYLFLVHLKDLRVRKAVEKSNFQIELSKKEMESKLERSRNSYLKAQINPHLLFNTLSFIYQDILASSPKAAEAIMTLSDIMRYSIACEYTESTIPLEEEIIQVKSLINLHSTRFDEELSLDFEIGKGTEQIKFIPLVLVTLAENIFKHGIFLDPKYPATLSVSFDEGLLYIRSRNLPSRKDRVISMNKGLENIRQRMEIAYGKDAKMHYGTRNDYFELEIKLRMD
jgi:two-component system LytT family sensor kinase